MGKVYYKRRNAPVPFAGGALSLCGVRPPLLVVLFVVLFLAADIVVAQDADTNFEGQTIAGIRFDPPDQPIPRADLERILPLKSGQPLNLADVRFAIQKLYETGRFADVSISGEPAGANQVDVLIHTQLNYFVSSVAVSGESDPPTKGQLLTATKLELGTLFQDNDLEQASENLQERLRANGLYHAKISTDVARRPETEEARIHFIIDPGDRARFDGIKLSGQFTRPAARIIGETKWRRGFGPITFPGWRYVTERLIQDGVGRVLGSLQRGDHLQAGVTLEELDYHESTNTVTPALDIESGPTLQVETIGAKVSRGRLRQLIPIYQERSVDRSLLMEGRRNLVDYFQSKGYFDAQVDFDDKAAEAAGAYVIDYNVRLGTPHKLVALEIEGNRYIDTPSLRERLETTPARWLRSRYGHYSQQMLDRDVQQIREVYRANGFRDVEVTPAVLDSYKGVNGHIAVHLAIKEGPQYFVGELALEGIPDSDLPYFRTVLQSIAEEPFSDVNVAADRDSILSYYYNNGYPDANFDWTEAPGVDEHHVNLRYMVTTGRREYTRAVLVGGLNTTRRSLVDNRIHLKPGDPISRKVIEESQQKLYDLGIFSKVQTAIQNPEGEEESKYVLYDLNEANLYSFNIGVGAQLGRIGSGVTTFDEPAGTTGFVPRISLGISRLNLFGEARTLSLQTRFSTIEQRALLNYVAPQFMGSENLTLTISGLFANSHDIRTFAERRYEAAAQLAERLNRQYSLQYRLTFRHVTLSDLVVSRELIPALSQPERVGMFSMTFIQDRRDDPINSHRGMYNTIDAGVSLRQLGSESEFTRLLMRNSTYYPIGRDVVLARTLQFGWIQRLSGLPEIPLAERFFAGGATSNRAFPDNQAGPRDPETGFPLGGNALLIHSTELRFPLFGNNVGGVLFHDMGNVYDDVRDISFRFRQHNLQDFGYMVQSVGFGIRYSTPIGPIRVDFSLSPDAPRFFGFQGTFDQLLAGQGTLATQKINAFQFHFSLGQTF